MKINKQTNAPFTTLELSSIAREYYLGFKSIQIDYGFDMLIATDGENTMSVMPDYIPETEDIRVFFVTVRRKTAEDGYERHIGVWDVTYQLPVNLCLTTPTEVGEAWAKLNKYITPIYYRKNGVTFQNGRPKTPADQDKYDREKDRRKYSKCYETRMRIMNEEKQKSHDKETDL